MRTVVAVLAALSLLIVPLSGATSTYSYDSLNRLARVVYPDGTTMTYTYDSAGNRLSQVISSPSVPLPTVGVDRTGLTFLAVAGQAATAQTIAVTNGGGGNLQWDAVATASWLNVTPGSGTNSGMVSVTASTAGMSAGTYHANVMILASASNAPVTIPVIFTITSAQGNPSITSGGIVSAAGSTPGIARGSVASLYGSALADASASAATVPLPTTLGNVRVSVNGVNAPLWYAGPGQINFQVPFESPLQGQASVVVTRDGVSSSPTSVTLAPYAPSIFTYQRATGIFDPIIVHAANAQLVTPTSPAVPGEYIVVYGTGIGDLTVVPATGAPSPTSPIAAAKVTPTATIGGVNASMSFAGLTPGGIGLAQFNVQVPTNLPTDTTAPLVINFSDTASPPVHLAINPGSGSGSSKTTANVQITFTPSSVIESASGTWNYSITLRETNGVGVTLTKVTINGVDYASSIATFFGSARLSGNGQLQASLTSTCSCNPPWDGNWQLTGNDDNGHTGLTWSGVVHFVASTTSSIATLASGLGSNAQGLAVDSLRNVYYAENNSVKRVNFDGVNTIIGGNGIAGFSGDGGPATSAQLNSPAGVAVDQSGNVYRRLL
jgi:uncharacterized protein (TIGR03437 family)